MRASLSLSLLFYITVFIIFSCSKSTSTGTVTTGTVPTGTVNPDSTAKSCIKVTLTSPKGTDSQTVGLNVPIAPIAYKISNNQNSDTTGLAAISVSAIGLPAGVTTTYINGVLTISGSPIKDSSNPYVYVIAATGNPCSLPLTGVISIKTCATLTRTSPLASYNHYIPTDSTIVPFTYSIGGGGTGAVATGLPPGLTGVFSNGTFTVSGTVQNSPDSDYKYMVTTTGGYCSTYDSGFLIVTTCPQVTLTSPVGTDKQKVSVNQTIQPITYTVTGHYTNFLLTGSFPNGVNAVISGNTITITGTPICQTCNGQSYVFEYYIDAYGSNFCGTLHMTAFIDVE